MLGEAEQREIPADADRAGAELVPEFFELVVDDSDMLELQAGAAPASGLKVTVTQLT